jgi:hypothetical protein
MSLYNGHKSPIVVVGECESLILFPSVIGVPVVLEQKTTIFWKCLYLLASLKDSPGLGGVYETNRRSEEENPAHR